VLERIARLSPSARVALVVAVMSAAAMAAILGHQRGGFAASTALSVATDVDMTPPGPAAVASGSDVTYTVNVTLLSALPSSMTIQLAGNTNLVQRSLTCGSTATPVAPLSVTGNPSCMYAGSASQPVQPGTYTFVFAAVIIGDVPNPVGYGASVVCADRNANNSCTDEVPFDQASLEDPTTNTGNLTVGLDARPYKGFSMTVAKDGVY
jgi:hypothetical protein